MSASARLGRVDGLWGLLTHLSGPDFGGQSACADVDPEMFFPLPDDRAGVEAARAVCAGCEIRSACAAFAVRRGMAYGIWGGLTEDERREIRAGGRGSVSTARPQERHQRLAETAGEQSESADPDERQGAKTRACRARRWAEMTPEQQQEYRVRKAATNRRYRARLRAQRTDANAVLSMRSSASGADGGGV